jgi:hypothetical protein
MEENNVTHESPKNEFLLKKKTFKYQAFIAWCEFLTRDELKELFPGVEKIHPEFFQPTSKFFA